MSKQKITYEESIHKMLERVLKNQIEILVWQMDPTRHNPLSTKKSIIDTIGLLEQIA